MTPCRPPSLPSFVGSPPATPIEEPLPEDSTHVACNEVPTGRTLRSPAYDPNEPPSGDEPGGGSDRSPVESPHLIRASSDGLRAASYYTHARPIAARFDTLPPTSPARVEVAPDPLHETKNAPYPGPLDTTPPATLVDTLPIGDRTHDTVPRKRRFRNQVLMGLGVCAMTLMFVLSLFMTWLSLRPRGRSAAALRLGDTRAAAPADPSATVALSAKALPSPFASASGAQSPLRGR